MKMRIEKKVPVSYLRPEVHIYMIFTEGLLCMSGTHDSLVEDDEWCDLLQ